MLVGATSSGGPDATGSIVFALVAAVGVIASTYATWRRAERRRDIATVAAKAGLGYAEEDPFGCTRVAFPLFTRGDGRGAENVLWRDTPDGRSYRAFDYWFYDEHRDEHGGTTRSYKRFSAAIALVGSSWPELSIQREGLAEKAVNLIGGGDIDFESEEFNRLFTVRCADRRFATALLDPQMLELVLSTRGELSFALKGRWLLIWRSPVPPRLVPGFIGLAERFVATIPPVVWELYPSPFVAEDGTVAPDDFGALEPAVRDALDEDDEPAEPEVEYDLDGNVVPPAVEDPWGDGRAPRHHI